MTRRRRARPLSVGSVTLAAVLLATVVIRAADDPAARPPPDPRPTSQGFSCSVAATADMGLPVSECEGLVDLYDLLGGAGWPHHVDWRRANQVCDRWQGVTCEQVEGGWHVTGLTLRDSGLVGDLGRTVDPDDLEQKSPGRALARLTELRVLNLSQNDLTGGIPAELGRLRRLRQLILYGNDLTGPIPSVLAELPDLVSLQLHDNRLSSSIPEGLLGSSCPGCEEAGRFGILMLAGNELTGHLPDDMGRAQVSTIDVRSNPGLSGPIPGSYTRLDDVEFFGFMFTSICIPPDPEIHVWLARIKSVLAPREADCEPGAVVPTLDPGAVTAQPATSASPSPSPSAPAATVAYLELLSRAEARRDELAVLEAQAEATGGAERLDRLEEVYAAWARAAGDYAKELTEIAFPTHVQPQVDALIAAVEREARVWDEFATDREFLSEEAGPRVWSATRAREAAERVLLTALGIPSEG